MVNVSIFKSVTRLQIEDLLICKILNSGRPCLADTMGSAFQGLAHFALQ